MKNLKGVVSVMIASQVPTAIIFDCVPIQGQAAVVRRKNGGNIGSSKLPADSTHLALHFDGFSTIPVEEKTKVLLEKTIEEEAIVGAQRLR